MDFKSYFTVWDKLTPAQQLIISETVTEKEVKKGALVHNGSSDCIGFLLVSSGQLRAYMPSEDGREITLFRLFEMDMCMFSASCMLQDIQFEINIEAEKDTTFWVIPPDIYKSLMEESAPLANYTNQLLSSHFSDVMWLLEQIMWKSMDKRLAEFLIEETTVEGTNSLKITHEIISHHLGTAREVVTRMLRYFQSEGLVKLSRGIVEVVDLKKLEEFA